MKETVPRERSQTVRQEIAELLRESRHTAGSLSGLSGIPEKEVYDHLEHLGKTGRLEIIPAECLKCGFVFRERRKIKKPSKCPECKGSHIADPMYLMRG